MSFLVYPLQDLICFQIADKQHIGAGLYADDVRHYRPYGLPFWAAVAGHNDVVPQIAFEYDALWEFDNRVRNDVFLQEAGCSRACFLHALRAAAHLYRPMRLFLIDRGIADQVDIENLTHCEFETDENRYYRVTSSDITHSQQGRNALDFVESVKSFWS